MNLRPTDRHQGRENRAYTLIEALVASSILLIGIAAAGSMSLALVTQEEINERSLVAVNYLDNASTLYHLGVDPGLIPALLPDEPIVESLTSSERTVAVGGLGDVPVTTLTLTYRPAAPSGTPGAGIWTGGDDDITRTIEVELVRAGSHLTESLPRADHFAP